MDADGRESSIFATRGLGDGVSPFSAPVNDLTRVRIVPNPYSILGGDLSAGGANFTGQPNKLLFVNLPARAIIRIFTLQGDLVTRIDHVSGSGDEEWPLMANDNNPVHRERRVCRTYYQPRHGRNRHREVRGGSIGSQRDKEATVKFRKMIWACLLTFALPGCAGQRAI